MDNNINVDDINVEKLREFLCDYYESAYFCGIDVAMGDLAIVESCSDEELIEYAIKYDFDLSNFKKNKERK